MGRKPLIIVATGIIALLISSGLLVYFLAFNKSNSKNICKRNSNYDGLLRDNDKYLVGEIPYESKNDNGDQVITVPIMPAKGVQNMEPQLALEYRSSMSFVNSELGLSWSLKGLSEISRCYKSIAHDGKFDNIKFSYDDVFCLDGQRLVLTGGSGYGRNGSEYRQELDGQHRIRAFEKQGNGPKYFIVNTKDNRIMTYSTTSALYQDNTPMRWLLTKVEDYSGNSIEYSYQTEENYSYLSRVAYANKQILFEYEPRASTDTQVRYYKHFLLGHLKKRLKSVLVGAVGDLTNKFSRRYVLAYKAYGPAILSLIDSVQVCFSDKCLKPLNFAYHNFDQVAKFTDKKVLQHEEICGKSSKECNIKQLIDMNGDGLSDVLAFGDDGVYVSLNRGLGVFEQSKLWTSSFSKTAGAWSIQEHIRLAADVNGDRLPDIIGFYNDGVYVALNQNGQKLDAMQVWLRGEFGKDSSAGYWLLSYDIRMLADMNNDGLLDIVGFDRSRGLLLSFNEGGKFGSAQVYSSKYKSHYPLPYFSIDDIDADSSMNFILSDYRYGSGYTVYTKNNDYTGFKINSRIANYSWDDYCSNNQFFKTFADVNGDNLPDLIGIWNNAVVVGQSEPVSEDKFEIEKIGEKIFTTVVSNYRYRQLADMNSDGLVDIVIFNCDGIYVSLGNGKGDFSEASLWSSKITSSSCPTNSFDQLNSRLAYDINGDGQPDAIAFENGGKQLRALLNQNSVLMLKSLNDSLGNYINYFYDTLTNKTVYNDDSSSDKTNGYTKYNVNRHVVSRVVSESNSCPGDDDDGDESIVTQNIEYKYGTYECHSVVGRSGCKFRWLETTDLVEKSRKRIEFYTRFPLSGQIKTEISYDSLGKKIEHKFNTYLTFTKQSSYDKLPMYHMLLNDTRIENYDNDRANSLLFTKITTYRYDEYDNMNRMLETTTMDAEVLSEETILTLSNDRNSWLIGQLQEETKAYIVSSKSWSSTKTVKTNFTYDKVSRLLASKVTHPNVPNLAVEEQYKRDKYGNVIVLRRIESSSGVERVEKFEYSANGINQIVHTNPLDQSETYEYDLMDRLVTVNDTNGLTIKSEFDLMGNKVREKNKDNSVIQWVHIWDFSLEKSVYRVEQYQLSLDELTLRETVYYDSLKRQVRTVTKGFNAENIVEERHYNKQHMIYKVSLKYKEYVEKPNYVYIEYDSRKREVARLEPRSERGDYIRTTTEYNLLRKTKKDSLDNVRFEERNLQGKIVRVEDAVGSEATYKYDALGNIVQIVDAHNAITNMDYDLNGNMLKLEEQSLGTVQFEFNAFNEMVRKVDSNRNAFVYTYDKLGRLVKRVESEGETEWIYDKSLYGIGKLAHVSFKPSAFVDIGPYNISYAYDLYSREIEELRQILDVDGHRIDSFTMRKTYDEIGRIKSQIYPNQNFQVFFCYNKYGYITGVSQNDDNCKSHLWKPTEFAASGQVLKESFASNNIKQEYTYDTASYLTKNIEARDNYNRVLRKVEFEYDNRKNLAKRVDYGVDSKFSSMNKYTYDTLDRITSWSSYKTPTQIDNVKSFVYDEMGNIVSYNGRVYQYDSQRPQRASKIGDFNINYDSMGNVVDASEYQIEWYSYLKAKLIRNGTTGSQVEFRYGPSYERIMKLAKNSKKELETVTHYVGDAYEKVVSMSNNEIVHKYYLILDEKIVCTHIVIESQKNSENATFYMLNDNAGSIDAVVDATGSVLLSYKYEAFGERKVSFYNTSMSKYLELLNRGYTGHEYVDESRLINMNGRIFDSVHLRFLSPDMNVQDIYNLQNLNRYIYCLNNPFKYKDPTGYFFKKLFKFMFVLAVGIFTFGQMMPVAAALTAGMKIGLLQSAAYYGILGASTGFTTTFVATGGNLKASLKGAIWGGITGAISGGLTYSFGLNNPGLFDIRKFGMETVTNGLVNKLNDRDFLDGTHMHIFSYVANQFFIEFTDHLNPDGAEIRQGDPVAEKNYYDPPVPKSNNFGKQGHVLEGGKIGDKMKRVAYNPSTLPAGNSLHEGSKFSIFMERYGPGTNAISFLHDMMLHKMPETMRETFIGNWGTMPIATFITYSAQYNQIQCPYCFDKQKKK